MWRRWCCEVDFTLYFPRNGSLTMVFKEYYKGSSLRAEPPARQQPLSKSCGTWPPMVGSSRPGNHCAPTSCDVLRPQGVWKEIYCFTMGYNWVVSVALPNLGFFVLLVEIVQGFLVVLLIRVQNVAGNKARDGVLDNKEISRNYNLSIDWLPFRAHHTFSYSQCLGS